MSKYIGFDIDCKKVVACVVENGKRDIYETLGPDVGSMRKFLLSQKQSGVRVELAFEISGEAGFIYDSLLDCVDKINVVNPTKMTWIYRTAKKNDRIDARKMAVLMSIGELPYGDRVKSRISGIVQKNVHEISGKDRRLQGKVCGSEGE